MYQLPFTQLTFSTSFNILTFISRKHWDWIASVLCVQRPWNIRKHIKSKLQCQNERLCHPSDLTQNMLPTKIYFTSTYHFEIFRIDVHKNNTPQHYQANSDFKDPVLQVRITPLILQYCHQPYWFTQLPWSLCTLCCFNRALKPVNQLIHDQYRFLWWDRPVHRSNGEETYTQGVRTTDCLRKCNNKRESELTAVLFNPLTRKMHYHVTAL